MRGGMDVDGAMDFLRAYWACVAAQDAEGLASYFWPDAEIFWHCTNERFTVQSFIQANCTYPGRWRGEVERVARDGELLVAAVRVWSDEASFHVCAFLRLEAGRSRRIDEYWGDDGEPPAWRRALRLGSPIRPEA